MAIAHHAHPGSDDVEIIEMSPTEYARAAANALNDLGLTYEQLAAQARSAQFTSLRARQLWLLIGDVPHDR
jgi:hypothetical protein